MIDIEPLVRDAILKLGYFHLNELEYLTVLYDRTRPNGAKGLLIDMDGELLSDQEKAAANIPPYSLISRRFLSSLTEKGKRDPFHAALATGLFISFNINRERDRRTEAICGDEHEFAQLRARANNTCAVARSQDGNKLPKANRPLLPLPGCDAEWCACSWGLVDE